MSYKLLKCYENCYKKILFTVGIFNNFLLLLILDKVLSNTDKDLDKRKIVDFENNEISHFFKVEKEVILKQKKWGLRYATCNGKNQSPIDLNFTVPVNPNLKNLKFSFYDKMPKIVTLTNTGYTVSFKAKWNEKIPIVSGGPLKDVYVFEKGHFHWGKNDKKGSEHTIECKRYPLELHLVHYKRGYGSVKEAVNYKDGLVVIGIIFQITNQNNSRATTFIRRLKKLVNSRKTSVNVRKFNLESFGLNTNSEFLLYKGSLTTPPCSEIVTWIISKQLSTINSMEMNLFREIGLTKGRKSNFRSLQWTNKRKVYSLQAIAENV
ncbi:carbonic anhydrase 2-like [Leptopilina boulardi]|uniref:carbonic anhydrase 2-like n=1 Tax=Leptopilina boulardi TaxID=63433 RepID=UPI0021F69C28|nr:carbonic anhydrase 2-like [Leptopilina boulardi]